MPTVTVKETEIHAEAFCKKHHDMQHVSMIAAIPRVSIIHKKTRTGFSILLSHPPVSLFSSIFYREERHKVAMRLFLWQLQLTHWFSAQCL